MTCFQAQALHTETGFVFRRLVCRLHIRVARLTCLSDSTPIFHKVSLQAFRKHFQWLMEVEEYDSELERMNADLANENQGLQYDNKQLNALLKEYEQTLDNVMSSFRKRAVRLTFPTMTRVFNKDKIA